MNNFFSLTFPRPLLLVLAGSFLCGTGYGEPEAPALAKMPEMVHFRVNYEIPKTPVDPNSGVGTVTEPVPVRVDVVRTGNLRREDYEMKDGSRLQVWYLGEFLFTENPGDSRMGASREMYVPGSGFIPIRPDLFPGCEWITPKHYAGEQKYESKANALYFKKSGEPVVMAVEDAPVEMSETSEAWLDPETRFPLAVRIGDLLRTFEFLPAPSSMLVPDARIVEQYKYYKKAWGPPSRDLGQQHKSPQ